ncbi:organic cation transporter protein-like [Maniola hyperantus]|uniref:organic cation transporter protein-like n=1 Tax=Aphantopus hyperantus TaxID=2795564 RepID=UPI00156A39F0|nr:organic cation transporter protein-like [Maniola hyperantus]
MNESSQKHGDVETVQESSIDEDRNANVAQEAIDLDYVLTHELGQFGLFQLRNFLLIAVVIIISGSVNEYIFSAAAIPHRCRIPECGEDTKLHEFSPEWISNAVPETSSGLASCERYAPVGAGSNGTLEHCPEHQFDQSRTIRCEGFVYAEDNTVVYDFDLGCNEWRRALAGTLFNVGMFLTLPITGYVSDRFGRKAALVVSVVNLGLFGLLRAFSVSYTMYLSLQIVQATLGTGLYSSAYIMATELVGPKYRVITGVTCTTMFVLGEMTLGGIAWLISPWRYMIMALTVPCFFFVSYYWLLTESVRWLLSKKKYTEAKEILHTVARVNKTKITEKSLEALLNPPQPSTKIIASAEGLGLVRTILRSPVLLRRVCTTPIWWITMVFIYYGLAINSTSLSDTMHLSYILTAAIGMPAFYISVFVLGRVGRKATVSCGFFICAVFNISFVFISNEYRTARLIIYLLGKFFIASVGTSLYLYTAELFPTEYRHTLLGFSSMIGRIGSIFAPLTPALMTYYHGIPSLLFGGMGIIAGVLVLTQPETLGCKMPDTLAEAEAIGKPESKIITGLSR